MTFILKATSNTLIFNIVKPE